MDLSSSYTTVRVATTRQKQQEIRQDFQTLQAEGLDWVEIMNQFQQDHKIPLGEIEFIITRRTKADEEPRIQDKEPVWPPTSVHPSPRARPTHMV